MAENFAGHTSALMCPALTVVVLLMRLLHLQVLPNSLLSVTPERGQVVAEGSAELEVALLLTQPGPLSTVLELDLRGGKILKLPIRWADWSCTCTARRFMFYVSFRCMCRVNMMSAKDPVQDKAYNTLHGSDLGLCSDLGLFLACLSVGLRVLYHRCMLQSRY